ncbi:MAG TPA: CvpA family protein [Stellaceae bacterium]|jgi:membrane protein required for colicin V production|nr:CvpA family protein [Stellaceae bacterium]
MNPLDIGVIAVVVLSAIFAFARGFVREALSIVAWVGAAYVTIRGFDWVYAQVNQHVHNVLLSQLIAGFGLFVVALIALTIVTGIIARMVQAIGLSPIDRTLGFIFGLARGAVLVCLAYLLLDFSGIQPNDRPGWIREAKSGPYLHQGAEVLKSFLPESLKKQSAEAAEELLRKVDPKGAAADLTKRAIEAPQNPTPPAAKPGPAPAPDYKSDVRRGMDRVIENNAR